MNLTIDYVLHMPSRSEKRQEICNVNIENLFISYLWRCSKVMHIL